MLYTICNRITALNSLSLWSAPLTGLFSMATVAETHGFRSVYHAKNTDKTWFLRKEGEIIKTWGQKPSCTEPRTSGLDPSEHAQYQPCTVPTLFMWWWSHECAAGDAVSLWASSRLSAHHQREVQDSEKVSKHSVVQHVDRFQLLFLTTERLKSSIQSFSGNVLTPLCFQTFLCNKLYKSAAWKRCDAVIASC